MNKFSTLNETKKNFLVIFSIYILFIPAKKYIKYFGALLGLIPGNLLEFKKKTLKT